MKIKGASSPFSGSADASEPLDPREQLRGVVKAERFAAALSNLEAQAAAATGTPSAAHATLRNIARNADLSSPDEAIKAVRESAQFIVESRLDERSRETDEGKQAVAEISEFVAADPSLRSKLLSILNRVKDDRTDVNQVRA